MSNDDEPMTDEAFATFLETASRGDLAAEGTFILGALEEAQEAVQSVDWARARRTLIRYRESFGPDANKSAMSELGFSVQAIDVLISASERLEALAIAQHGN